MAIRGFAWPMRSSATSTPGTVEDAEAIAASVRTILTVGVGSRLMRPGFGSRLHGMLFENVDAVLAARVRRAVSEALTRGEPRIRVTGISVDVEDTQVTVYVEYVWRLRTERVSSEFARAV
jgi:phage baseplate assembly protein W